MPRRKQILSQFDGPVTFNGDVRLSKPGKKLTVKGTTNLDGNTKITEDLEVETGQEPEAEAAGDSLEFNDYGETPAEPGSLPSSRQEEKDLEDVVS